MNPFKTASSIATPLDRTNVDTDQIIPKQFLKSTERTGFGKNLFYGWRYDSKGEPVKDFILNNPAYDGSQVLVAGENFGCGSSREHAWAILDRGFSVVAAPSLFVVQRAMHQVRHSFQILPQHLIQARAIPVLPCPNLLVHAAFL